MAIKNNSIFLVLLFAGPWLYVPVLAQDRLSLAGEWQLLLDPDDRGVRERWWLLPYAERVRLPGSLTENGKGNPVTLATPWVGDIADSSYFHADKYKKYREGDLKLPFWLKPALYYAAPAWYKRQVAIPPDWKGKRLTLNLERCHWETTVYVNGLFCGTRNSLVVPHQFDLTDYLRPGQNTVVVRVDNRVKINIGPNSHSISDHTQTNWNGIAGDLSIVAEPKTYPTDVQIYPNVTDKTIRVALSVQQPRHQTFRGRVRIQARSRRPDSPTLPALEQPISTSTETTALTATYPIPNARLWDEFTPNLYDLTVQLLDEQGKVIATEQQPFGMREIGTKGTRITINGRPIFLRGDVDCAAFPITGYPPTTEPYWEKIMTTARQYGLNHLRFHSWCPPKAAFDVADRLGIYLYVESPLWANQSSAVGTGGVVDDFIYAESERILQTYGNHPSFCLMSYGNEPEGRHREDFLGRWVDHFKANDSRRLYTSGAGWPILPENQFHIDPNARIQPWGAGLKSPINKGVPRTNYDWREVIKPFTVPYIAHEIGEWCSYPNLAETTNYTGVLKATNYDLFRETLTDAGMGDQAAAFLHASGRLQTLCYKADIEAALRTPGFGGFQLLGLHDFPGQGTTPVGVLDVFWESKGYTTPTEYSQFCGPTVLLARLDKLIYQTDETLRADLEIAHFGAAELRRQSIRWQLRDATGKLYGSGHFGKDTVRLDNAQPVGTVQAPLSAIKKPTALTLVVALGGTSITNSWPIWVYPASLNADAATGRVVVAHALTPDVLSQLQNGANVLLLPVGKVRNGKGAEVAIGFSSIFWNTSWTRRQAPHTLGLVCDPAHSLFDHFPTEANSNYQWHDLESQAQAIVLTDFPKTLRPLVQPIDDWYTNRRLALAFEGRVGKGKLLVCSVDLETDLANRPPARQFKYSLLRYMNSPRFAPTNDLPINAVQQLFRDEPTTTSR